MRLLQTGLGGLETLLLGATVVLLLVVVGLLLTMRGYVRDVPEIGDDVETIVEADRGVDTDQLTAAVSQTFTDLEVTEKLTRVEDHAAQVEDLHADLERMLRHPQDRGAFGEAQLDVILSEHLPPEMYGLREQVVAGKTPDAHIRSSAGLICVDAKFPLENYEAFVAADDEETAERYRRQFADDVERQLAKIETDYVRPTQGTTDFAFAFIPSEGVYYHLVTEEYDLLREYAAAGVQVVSPLTFGHKLEIVKAGVHAEQLSEQAEEIGHQLERLGEEFAAVEAEWETLQRHIRNAHSKAEDVDAAYRSLRDEFDRVEDPTLTDAAEGDD